jgi:hypothetical protein
MAIHVSCCICYGSSTGDSFYISRHTLGRGEAVNPDATAKFSGARALVRVLSTCTLWLCLVKNFFHVQIYVLLKVHCTSSPWKNGLAWGLDPEVEYKCFYIALIYCWLPTATSKASSIGKSSGLTGQKEHTMVYRRDARKGRDEQLWALMHAKRVWPRSHKDVMQQGVVEEKNLF